MNESPPNEWGPPAGDDPLLRPARRSPGFDGRTGEPPNPTRGGSAALRRAPKRRNHPVRGARALALAASVTATVAIAGAMALAEGTEDETLASPSGDSGPDPSSTESSTQETEADTGILEPATSESATSESATEEESSGGWGRGQHRGGDTASALGEDGEATATESVDPTDSDLNTEPTARDESEVADEPAVAESSSNSAYGDGVFTGTAEYTEWGDVQVEVTITAGQIADIEVLQVPSDRKSSEINARAVPVLTAQAIEAQSADLDIVSGATYTSRTYADSLQAALDQATLAQEADGS